MITSSIREIYQPIEHFLAVEANNAPAAGAPTVTLQPLDAFLLVHIARFLPQPPQVIDLAAPSTAGATAVLWAVQRKSIHGVWLSSEVAAHGRFLAAAAQVGLAIDGLTFGRDPRSDLSAAVIRAPLLVVTLPSQAVVALDWLEQTTAACVVVLGIGRTGESPVLADLLANTGSTSPYRLHLLRELAPALAASQLAVVLRRDWPDGPAVLERLAWLFQGNFDFLRLANENLRLHEQAAAHQRMLAALTNEVQQLRQRSADGAPPPAAGLRLRRLFRATLPLTWRRRIRRVLGDRR